MGQPLEVKLLCSIEEAKEAIVMGQYFPLSIREGNSKTPLPYSMRKMETTDYWQIGSDGRLDKAYTVGRGTDGFWSCTCQGFHYKRGCRHCAAVEEILKGING